MEKKTERIKFWLTDKELKQIDRKAKKLGMNRSEYIRYLIANCKLVHTPDIDYESYYNKLKYISDKINNHLIFLNQTGTLDEPQFHKLCEEAVETAKQEIFPRKFVHHTACAVPWESRYLNRRMDI